MILIFFGPPGAGKGTQAKFVSRKLNIVHLSTGEILRNQLKKESKLSLDLKRTMETGQLVSDKILNKIVLERIMQKDCNKGFIFDGYPRTINQAIFIDDYLVNNNLSFNYFIEFKIDDDSIIERIISRALTESRSDDSKEAIKTRLEKYYGETRPVLDYYQKKYSSIYHKIDGKQEIAKLNNLLIKLLIK